MRGELWERDRERQVLEDALDAVCRGEGRLLTLDGPAGIGKSELLRSARDEAVARGLLVLSARGLELERSVPFGLARRLFVPALLQRSPSEQASVLSGPAATAAAVVRAEPGGSAMGEGGAGALVEGLYWLAVNLVAAGREIRTDSSARPGPAGLVLVVDDAQWADRSSLRFLLHAVSALEQIAICVLVAIRTGEIDAPSDLLGRLLAHPGCVRLTPAVLSEKAVDAVVRASGFPDAHPDFSQACARASGGNPFLLVELLTVLAADAADGSAAAAQRVDALLPESVLHAVLVRVGRLPRTAAALAGAVAVLDQAPLPLAAAVADLELPAAEDAADILIRAHLFPPDETLSFVHPLLAAAVRADLPPLARSRAHRRAASLLEADGADVGRIAGHLLQTRPAADPWVARTLRSAGRDALLNGESGSAVRLLRRALGEPPPEDDRASTLVELAQAEAADDDPAASRRLTDALRHVSDGRRRAEVHNQLARLRFFKGDIAGAADAAEAGLAELDPSDELSRQLLSSYFTAATFDSRLRPDLGERLAPHLNRARAGQVPQDPLICAHLGARMAIAGDPAELVAPVLEQALGQHPLVDESAHGVVLAFPIVALVIIDQLDRADRALADAIASPYARRSVMTITVTQHWSAVTAFRRGDLVGAEAHARRASAACDSDEWDLYGGWIAANLAQVLLEQGNPEAAGAVLADARAVDPVGRCLVLEARARVAAVLDDAPRAYELYTEAGRALDAMGLVNPGFISWRSSAALAAKQIGRAEEASQLAAADLAIARRTGTSRSIGVALHASALLAPPDEAVGILRDSVAALEQTRAPLELARASIALGAALRRTGRSSGAREPLRQALDLATRAGAGMIARQAEDELRATGSKPRRAYRRGVEALTPTERRIADLVAKGRTNAQIAHDLYITIKTVEWHLSNVFQKLDVSSRQQVVAPLVRG